MDDPPRPRFTRRYAADRGRLAIIVMLVLLLAAEAWDDVVAPLLRR